MTRLALAFLLFSAMPAAAQYALCGPRASIVASLAEKYGEGRLGAGLDTGRTVVEVFTAPSGSWTALRTLPTGVSCVLATGEAWHTDPPKVEVEGDPS